MSGLRAAERPGAPAFDAARVREEFPILRRTVNGRPLVYLDNAATTQKPSAVLEAMDRFYTEDNSNVHRGVHRLSQRATASFEAARDRVRAFLHAADSSEIVFTRGATEAINLVAASWGRTNLRAGDTVLVTGMEHHSNIVPWQLACQATGARLRHVPVTDDGDLDLAAWSALLAERPKLVAMVHVSNALGTVNPVRRLTREAHDAGALVLVDGAQAVAHLPVDVREIGCDFYALSGHKMYGPTGIGVLYARAELLEAMPPWQGGGDMISSVSFEKTTWNRIPFKFEAGTPNVAGAVGLGAAVAWLESTGLSEIGAFESAVVSHAIDLLRAVPGIRLIGTPRERASVVSFVLEGVHAHDLGTILDSEGIAVRSGHHCAQPLMERFGVPATARASFGVYNTPEEADALVAAIGRVREVFFPEPG